MNISELLKGRECSCGKNHTCNIYNIVIEEGAINKIYDLAAEYKHIILVADKNTYDVCGRKAAELLKEKLQDKAGVYNEDKMSVYKEKWNEIRNILNDAPTADKITAYLESVGLDISDFEKMYGEKNLKMKSGMKRI